MNPDTPRNPNSVRINYPADRPASGDSVSSPRPAETFDREGFSRSVRPRSWGPVIMLVTILVVLGVLGAVLKDRLTSRAKTASPLGNSEFQAVFLTNGQVYFGKLSNPNNSYITLEDVYYLQVTPVLQTKTEGQPGSQANPQQQLSLVKLGSELHAPVDKMSINRDQILFFEDLKDDGRVVKAIREFENAKK